MNAPIPLRPDVNAFRESAMRSLARATIDKARRVRDRYAKSAWPDDHIVKLITRGAVTQTTLADAEVLQQVGLAFVSSLVPVSAAAAVIASSLKLTFDSNAQISVPSLTLPHAVWLSEGQPIPVMQGLTTPGTLIDPYKVAMIVALTNEMLRLNSNAEAMVRAVLLENAGPTLDSALFSAGAASPGLRPAGVLNGIAPLPPSSATSPYDAMVADIAAIATALAPASGASPPILVAAPAQYVPLAMNARNPWSVLMSASLPAGTVIGVIPAALATVIEPPRIEASSTMVQMDDQPSADPLTGPTISLYQTDSIGLRFILPATWSLRSPSGVAWVDNVTW